VPGRGEARARRADRDQANAPPGWHASPLPQEHQARPSATDLQPMAAARERSVLGAHGIPPRQPVIATIGRTDPVKGIDLLIDAAAPLRD